MTKFFLGAWHQRTWIGRSLTLRSPFSLNVRRICLPDGLRASRTIHQVPAFSLLRHSFINNASIVVQEY